MGQTPEFRRLSDAAGRRPHRRLAAGSDLKSLAAQFARDESGATAIEYGLIAACIFLVIVTAVTAFAGKTTSMYDMISTVIGGAIGS